MYERPAVNARMTTQVKVEEKDIVLSIFYPNERVAYSDSRPWEVVGFKVPRVAPAEVKRAYKKFALWREVHLYSMVYPVWASFIKKRLSS